jgi:GNAT superfamily N-acetyltransferase
MHDQSNLITCVAGDPDTAELLVLQRCCWVSEAFANDTLDIPPLRETLDDIRDWVGSWTVLTMRDGPRLIAAVRGRLVGETWEIGRLMVAPDLSGQGIGRRLLAHIERLAPVDAAMFELFTGARSTRNIELYERAGYRVADSVAVTPGHITGAIVLRKPATSPSRMTDRGRTQTPSLLASDSVFACSVNTTSERKSSEGSFNQS